MRTIGFHPPLPHSLNRNPLVLDGRHLEYEGALYSTSDLAVKLLGLKAAQGSRFWWYKGRTLLDIRDGVYRREVSYKDADGVKHSGIARCRMEGKNRFVVLAGSFISLKKSSPSLSADVLALRESVRLDAKGCLMEDVVFKKISPSASFVSGCSRSGAFWTKRQR